ncbi:hypothetical protein V6N13_013797 [Hibiscus sabdariffa]
MFNPHFPEKGMDIIGMLVDAVVSITSLFTIFVFFLCYRLLMPLVSSAKALFKENVRGKVILITGASSGIGEHVAYEYARRGARLALVARRERRLQQVGGICEMIGSPEAVFMVGDVANIEDCKRFVDATVSHFGQLDHLVTNAGVTPLCLFQDYDDITKASPAMASKAAVISFYETLRMEFGGDVGITIVTPGLIKTEMTDGKFLSKQGELKFDRQMRDVEISLMPLESGERCGKTIVEGACRGERYLTVPNWYESTKLWKVLGPEMMDGWLGFLLMPWLCSNDAPTKMLSHFANWFKESPLRE